MNNRLWAVALVFAGSLSMPLMAAPAGLVFIEDDYAAAAKLAKDTHKPLFVDAWAPWCHSCLFLKEHVFTRPEMQKHQSEFVWLSVDTEKAVNAPFLEKYPVEVWPTLMVLDSDKGNVVLKWSGTGTVEQMEKLFADAQVASHAEKQVDAGSELLKKADGLWGEKKAKEAAVAYGQLVTDKQFENSSRRSRALESWLNALYVNKEYQSCTEHGLEFVGKVVEAPSYASVVSWAMTCAQSAEDVGGVVPEWKKKAIPQLNVLLEKAVQLPGLLADDRSGLYEMLVEEKDESHDVAAKKKWATQWWEFLDKEAAQAKNPAARAAFDPHRSLAATMMGEPLRVESALIQSEKDFPNDYNPAARLAAIYREAKQLDKALKAADRALGLAYGPRKLRVYQTKLSILKLQKDVSSQKSLLTEAVAYGKSLPKGQQRERDVAQLESDLRSLSK